MAEHILQLAIDPHVHTRGFEQAYKETVETASMAAIAGGVGTIIGMPNYEPVNNRPYTLERMNRVLNQAYNLDRNKDLQPPYADVGFWATFVPELSDPNSLRWVVPLAMGNKFYIEATQGNPTAQSVDSFMPAARVWREYASDLQPIAAHIEDSSAEEAIAKFAGEVEHPVYVPHINNRFLLDTVIAAKKKGLPVYAGTTIDHMFMTEEAVERKGWFARMKPPLASQEDQDYINDNLAEWIDVIETDHAGHTKQEKRYAEEKNPEGKTGRDETTCFGTPNLEAFMPALTTAVLDGKLTWEQLEEKTVTNPAKIFGIKPPIGSYVKIEEVDEYEFGSGQVFSKPGWNSFEGERMRTRVIQVVLRGAVVFENGRFTDEPRQGRIVRPIA